MAEKRLTIEKAEPLLLFGFNDSHLRRIEAAYPDAQITARGNKVYLRGSPDDIDQVERLLNELILILNRNGNLTENDVETVLALYTSGDGVGPASADVGDVVLFTPSGGLIRAKSPNQARLVEAARRSDIVFAIGPAGTGKTYTGVALAVAALKARQVKRIVLCRPAVEAGERLGFLPGDFREKVDPYLRPLYDALEDMLPAEKLRAYMEQHVVEIVPLAFMRGRAQPLSSRVLTPEGYKRMGDLSVGGSVIGSDGKATRIVGVYPQGEKDVFRVTMSDGASTLCCAEHLWSVYTPADKRRGKGPRVLQTQEMAGHLRTAHQHRYELPLLSAPVDFPERPVTIDPYTLGLLLGGGCLTGSTCPSFTTSDPELAAVLQERLEGVEVKHKEGYDYTITKPSPSAGCLPNPLVDALRHVALYGVYSATKFIPEKYLYNSAARRIEILQGLLDSDGGPVLQKGRTCRIQYTTTSPRLRDDVLFLVRSLGGVATCRSRPARGRTPGRANGREVRHRTDAYVLDVRLPSHIRPFRLKRKAEAYAAAGGGRPMRFITRIEKVGVEATQCIRVAAPDSLYVTDDFILTHNTLNSAFVILDEAQNATTLQMKMFLTRLGANSRAIITGDMTQIDLPSRSQSGLLEARQILEGIEGIDFIYFDKGDVVRHRLVKDIIDAYARHTDEGDEENTPDV